ncbi:hypothetical protein D0T23_13955 [Duganella sp. BJB475]|nr:hypothetical protein D0T23_13955 [Duganella sp. BJB475]RFP36230.1 hypothetical protein D0T21_07310 [Duganella sp. BJB476]
METRVDSDVIVVSGNKMKAALVFLGSTAFVAIGVAMIRSGDNDGWGAVVFFGLCLLVSLYMLMPNAIRLKIDKNGVEMKTLFKPIKLAWSDVETFYVGGIRTGLSTTKLIGIKYSSTYNKARAGRQFSSSLTGMEGALPNHFSKSAEELCALLNDAKRRWSQPI